jgi:hypothetical protein
LARRSDVAHRAPTSLSSNCGSDAAQRSARRSPRGCIDKPRTSSGRPALHSKGLSNRAATTRLRGRICPASALLVSANVSIASRRVSKLATTPRPRRLRMGTDTPFAPCQRGCPHWIRGIGLDPCMFGTHSLRRTKATLIHRRTGNLRAVQLLLGHTKIESTVRYLGVEVDDLLFKPARGICIRRSPLTTRI